MTPKDQILHDGALLTEGLLYKESIARLADPLSSSPLIGNPFKHVTERTWFGDGRPYAVKLVGELAPGVTVTVEFDHPVTPDQLVSVTENQILGRGHQMLLDALKDTRQKSADHGSYPKEALDGIREHSEALRAWLNSVEGQ